MKRLNKLGYTIMEVVITTGLVMVIFSAFTMVLQVYTNNQQNLAYADRKQDLLVTIINLINNDQAWQKTVDSLANTGLDCLKDPAKFPTVTNAGACDMAVDGGAFSLLDEAGTIFLDSTTATAGFSLNAGPCNSYSATGDDFCPLRAEVTWRPLCVTCTNNQIEVTITLKDTPKNRKNAPGSILTRKLVRYGGPFDIDLVLFMKLDGTVGSTAPAGTVINDLSGYKNNGVVTEIAPGGTNPTYFAGKVGQGLGFDTVANTWKWIAIPDTSSLRPSTLTVAAWVRWTGGVGPDVAGIVNKHFRDLSDSYTLRVQDANTFAFCYAEADAGSPLPTLLQRCVYTNAAPILTNTWYYVAATYDGKQMKIYLNGVLQADVKAYTGPNYWASSSLLIGVERQDTWANPYGEIFPGVIDHVKIWKRALKDNEILREYNNPL